ncbi:ABC transporter substrate-binding protein, partial [Rhizobium brockwellii]
TFGKALVGRLLIVDHHDDFDILAEGVVGQMEKLGLKIVINAIDGAKRDDAHYAGRFDWLIQRNTKELSSVVQNTEQLAPVGPRTSWHH